MKKTTIIFVAVLIIAVCFSLVISGSGALNNENENLPEYDGLTPQEISEKVNFALNYNTSYEQEQSIENVEKAKKHFKDEESYLESIRINELYRNMTETQKEQIAELRNDKRARAGVLGWEEMLVLGEVDENSSRLTYEDAIRILSENETYDAVLEEIEKIQKYPDIIAGSGTTFMQYWFDGTDNFMLHIDVLYHNISIFDERDPNNKIHESFFQGNVRIDNNSIENN